ncbi:hypothetical protein D9M68_807770 [compost metagenome]
MQRAGELDVDPGIEVSLEQLHGFLEVECEVAVADFEQLAHGTQATEQQPRLAAGGEYQVQVVRGVVEQGLNHQQQAWRGDVLEVVNQQVKLGGPARQVVDDQRRQQLQVFVGADVAQLVHRYPGLLQRADQVRAELFRLAVFLSE